MYVRGYLQGSENGRVVTIDLQGSENGRVVTIDLQGSENGRVVTIGIFIVLAH